MTPKMIMQEHKKQIPVINVSFTLLIYENPIQIIEKFEDVRWTHDPRDFDGGVFEIDNMIYLGLQISDRVNHGVVAHECKHLLNMAYKHVGAELDVSDDEIECYFLQWIINAVYEEFND